MIKFFTHEMTIKMKNKEMSMKCMPNYKTELYILKGLNNGYAHVLLQFTRASLSPFCVQACTFNQLIVCLTVIELRVHVYVNITYAFTLQSWSQ